MATANNGKFKITKEIERIFKLGNAGKTDAFLTRAGKHLRDEIETLEHEILTENMNNKRLMAKIKDALEDANNKLKESYSDIPVENIGSNSKEIVFLSAYFKKIEISKKEVEEIKEDLKKAEELHEKCIKDLEERISSLKNDLDIISEE